MTMHNNQFMKRFFEIIAGKSLPHTADKYDHIKFEVTITPEVKGENPIVIFSGEHSIFPIIVEHPVNKHHLMLGFTDICFFEKTTKVRKGKKRKELLILVDEYLRSNKILLEPCGDVQ